MELVSRGLTVTGDITRILVPIDFSPNSRRALDHAIGLALRFGASIHLIHVSERAALHPSSLDGCASCQAGWRERIRANAEMQLADIARCVTRVPVSTEVRFGQAAPVIVETAAIHHADLIVMGTNGHGARMRAFLGAVAERVIESSPCSVVTVDGGGRDCRARRCLPPGASQAFLTPQLLVS